MLLMIIKTEMAVKRFFADRGINPITFGWSMTISITQTILLLLILLKIN